MDIERGKTLDSIILKFNRDDGPIYWKDLEEELGAGSDEFKAIESDIIYLIGEGVLVKIEYLKPEPEVGRIPEGGYTGVQLDDKGIPMRRFIKELGFEKKARVEARKSLIERITMFITIGTFVILIISTIDTCHKTNLKSTPTNILGEELLAPEPQSPKTEMVDSDTCSTQIETIAPKAQE